MPFCTLHPPTPMLIVHGTTDLFLSPEHAQRVYDAAAGDKQITWIETHNHIGLYDQDPCVSEAAAHVIQWLDTRMRGETE
jgi:fermentation-respiration switch protein FrsA (DUF1100 family)